MTYHDSAGPVCRRQSGKRQVLYGLWLLPVLATCATEGEFNAPIDETKKCTVFVFSPTGSIESVWRTDSWKLDDGLRGTIRVTVTDASGSILAVDELLNKNWGRVAFGKNSNFLEYKNGQGCPLIRLGQRWEKCGLQTMRSQGADNRIAANGDQDLVADGWQTKGPMATRVHPRRTLFAPLHCDDCRVDPT